MCDSIYVIYIYIYVGRPLLRSENLVVDLLSVSKNKLPLYISPLPDPMIWKEDSFQHPLYHLGAYSFPAFAIICQIVSKVRTSNSLTMIFIALLWLQQEWLPVLLFLLTAEPIHLPLIWDLLGQLHGRKFHNALKILCFTCGSYPVEM